MFLLHFISGISKINQLMFHIEPRNVLALNGRSKNACVAFRLYYSQGVSKHHLFSHSEYVWAETSLLGWGIHVSVGEGMEPFEESIGPLSSRKIMVVAKGKVKVYLQLKYLYGRIKSCFYTQWFLTSKLCAAIHWGLQIHLSLHEELMELEFQNMVHLSRIHGIKPLLGQYLI